MKIENIILLYIFIIITMTTINENGIDVFTCKFCELECEVLFTDQDGNFTFIDYCETCCGKHPALMEVANILEADWKQNYLSVKMELDYWKKYKHLDFEKLGEDEDYWDCVVQEHNLERWIEDNDTPLGCRATYPDILEYKRFCKYFPRPKYDSDSD
tara:strand:+ start:107 stop:577 length:471 start_codon:yes stop_codon:yes gene_type:complete